jgi:single-strand DNA-binding protein
VVPRDGVGQAGGNLQPVSPKGSKVLVEGRLTPDPDTGGPRIWESNGKMGTSYEVTASTGRFLSGREAHEEGEGVGGAGFGSDIPF